MRNNPLTIFSPLRRSNILNVYCEARKDPAMRGVVSAEQLVMALMDSGTLPVVGRLHHQMMSAYANHATKLIVFRFPDFIEQVDCIRKEEKAIREAAFRSWYTIHKWSDENKILTLDMAQLIMDLSLVSDSCRNVQDVRLLVDDVHREASESLYLGRSLEKNQGWLENDQTTHLRDLMENS